MNEMIVYELFDVFYTFYCLIGVLLTSLKMNDVMMFESYGTGHY